MAMDEGLLLKSFVFILTYCKNYTLGKWYPLGSAENTLKGSDQVLRFSLDSGKGWEESSACF